MSSRESEAAVGSSSSSSSSSMEGVQHGGGGGGGDAPAGPPRPLKPMRVDFDEDDDLDGEEGDDEDDELGGASIEAIITQLQKAVEDNPLDVEIGATLIDMARKHEYPELVTETRELLA
mmetsp:Transcript_26257/g.75317  ORF Transcript_26257/g.75317 Transcript_26257/m.75317 type:complete len:119 (+) Transcript_26257:186-542(+)